MRFARTILPGLLLLTFSGLHAQDGQTDPANKPKPNPWWQAYSFSAGVWVPQNKLAILGTHPSLGLIGGLRNMQNEFDIDFSFRFIRAPGDYKVKRLDTLFSLNHFFGGYVGLDYVRYVLFSSRWELGGQLGIGYDGFEIANDDDSGDNDYLSPLDIGCLNVNVGFRFNYYFKGGSWIGVMPRFNFLRYTNPGGSSLFGNAFSFELTLGAH